MTDKEIIIDGVDVSECEYSFKQFDNWIGKDVVMCDCTLGCRCEPKENHCKFYMYYLEQQLKRKEQEYEDLRTHCKHIDETNKILYNEKVQLLDKNQELQDKLLKLNDLTHEVLLYELQTLDIDFDEYETHVRDTEFSPIVTRCAEMIDLIGYSDKCNKEV